MPEPHPIAVVGLGIGQMHVRALRRMKDRFTVVAIADVDRSRADAVAERIHADVLTFDEILANDAVEIVSLCTPPTLHLDQLVAALQAGKHVVCEKPLVASLADVDRVEQAEAESRGRVMPVFQYRFGNGLQKVRALVDGGHAGRAYTSSVEVAWRRRADYYAVPWRGRWETELGGVLLSQAIHALDMLTYIVGPPASVFCRTATRVNAIEVEDCAAASLAMADSSLATVSATLGSPQEISRHRFHFEGFSAESGTAAYESSSEPWDITPDDPSSPTGVAITELLDGWTPGTEGWQGQYERLADALDAGAGADADLPVTLADARAAIELVTALYASAREGADVALPIAPDHPFYGGWCE